MCPSTVADRPVRTATPPHLHAASSSEAASAPPASLGFHFTDDGCFAWDGEVDFDANAILSAPDQEERTARDDAKDFLRDILKDGGVPANNVLKESRQCGIAERTLRRAVKDLGVVAARTGEEGKQGGGVWVWNLPSEDLDGHRPPVWQGGSLNRKGHENGSMATVKAATATYTMGVGHLNAGQRNGWWQP